MNSPGLCPKTFAQYCIFYIFQIQIETFSFLIYYTHYGPLLSFIFFLKEKPESFSTHSPVVYC